MLAIVLGVLLGGLFVLLAYQNPQPVTLVFFDNAISVPLYAVAAFSFLTGLFIALVYHLIDIANFVNKINSKNSQISELTKVNQSLESRLNSLSKDREVLTEDLRDEKNAHTQAKRDHTKDNIQNFFFRLRKNFS